MCMHTGIHQNKILHEYIMIKLKTNNLLKCIRNKLDVSKITNNQRHNTHLVNESLHF